MDRPGAGHLTASSPTLLCPLSPNPNATPTPCPPRPLLTATVPRSTCYICPQSLSNPSPASPLSPHPLTSCLPPTMDNAEWDTVLQYISDPNDFPSPQSERPVSEMTGIPLNTQHPTPTQVLTPPVRLAFLYYSLALPTNLRPLISRVRTRRPILPQSSPTAFPRTISLAIPSSLSRPPFTRVLLSCPFPQTLSSSPPMVCSSMSTPPKSSPCPPTTSTISSLRNPTSPKCATTSGQSSRSRSMRASSTLYCTPCTTSHARIITPALTRSSLRWRLWPSTACPRGGISRLPPHYTPSSSARHLCNPS